MKFLALLACLIFVGCNSNTRPVAENANSQPMRAEKLQDTRAHTTENQPPANAGKWSASGDPIPTAEFDKAITAAVNAAKEDEDNQVLKKAAAEAYFKRGFALTETRQYAAALGDYRRALKYDPDHVESKEWIDQITNIYTMLKKAPPKEGEEPKPLKVKK